MIPPEDVPIGNGVGGNHFLRAQRPFRPPAHTCPDESREPFQQEGHLSLATRILPSGTVTFLFTDIEGSTALWERDRPAMAAAVDRHMALLRSAIETHGGVPFKMIGDAIQAAFSSVPDAVAAALDAQRTLLAEDWGGHGPLRVRMALHVGEATPRDHDYVAPELNRLSRLLNAGHGGQILLSEAVRLLVRGSLPSGVSLRDLGTHRLRDLIEPERVFQLITPDLRGDFPPLKSLDARPNNLPRQPTPFIGRDQEITAVAALLRGEDAHLVTLTGTGGVGKTRLALQAAADLLDDFPDGVFFVSLDSVKDPALVLSAIAQTLGLREEGPQPVVDQVREYLAGKKFLLVIDSFEHVLPAAQQVDHLLSGCRRLKVLITSRQPTRLTWEREVEVSPMTADEAVVLFEDRARSRCPDVTLTDENRPVVAELCARLDGLPLAIELVAAHMKMLPPAVILERVGHRLDLLSGGPVNAPPRQRTMRATIEWSYELLAPDEQALFRRMGGFSGGCTLEAAEAIAHAAGPLGIPAAAGLEALVEASLVRAELDHGAKARFGMLETVRDYAVEKLLETEEIVATWEALANFYVALVDTCAAHWGEVGAAGALDELAAEYPTIRTILNGLLLEGHELGLILARDLGPFWRIRGYLIEGRIWLERILSANIPAPPALRGDLLRSAGSLAYAQGDFRAADAQLGEALAIARGEGDDRRIVDCLNELAAVAHACHDNPRASSLFDESLGLAKARGYTRGEAASLIGQGVIAHYREHQARAAELYERALEIHRELGDQVNEALVLGNLGNIEHQRGDLDRARRHFSDVLTIHRRLGNRIGVAGTFSRLGILALDQDEPERAEVLYREAQATFRELGIEQEVTRVIMQRGNAASAMRQTTAATERYSEAIDRSRQQRDPKNLSRALANLGNLLASSGDIAPAAKMLKESLVIRRELEDTEGMAYGLAGLAEAAIASGNLTLGATLHSAQDRLRRDIGLPVQAKQRPPYEAKLAWLRDALGTDTYDAAWAAGQDLTTDEAIDKALSLEVQGS